MKCYICDKTMSEQEIQYLPLVKSFDCCGDCLEVALDAAYSDGFDPNNASLDDKEFEEEFGSGVVSIFDKGAEDYV